MKGRLAPVALSAVLLAACGSASRDAANGGDSVSAGSASATAVTPGGARVGANPPACPRTGHWSECQVRSSIERAGLVLRDTVFTDDLPKLSTAPRTYRLGSALLATWLFADTSQRARAARSLDSTRFVPSAAPLTMQSVATAIENDNLLALFYGKNEHQRERVTDAFTAGAPQP
jgi:hypothetical protein